MLQNLEVICLIYKSIDYLKFIVNQLEKYSFAENWNISYRIIANDASQDIIDYLKINKINHSIYNDPKPNEYYLNRVYRCWNFAVGTSNYDNICFVNSDMAFHKDWLTNLLKHHNGINIPCSRLVESGKYASKKPGITYNCGNHPKNFNYEKFNKYCETLSVDQIARGGLYMPCIFETKKFLDTGGYPEGNVYRDRSNKLVPGKHGLRLYKPGDVYYFIQLEKYHGMKHITVFDSLVYHVQEGEMDA